VLAHPADDFVAEFVGSGAAVRRLSLLPISQLELAEIVISGAGAAAKDRPVLLVDDAGRPSAWHHAPGSERPPALVTVPLSGTVYDAVDDDGQPRGALRWDSLVADLRPNGQLR
jgi:osmoprotectant transport system ATP-binding protein